MSKGCMLLQIIFSIDSVILNTATKELLHICANINPTIVRLFLTPSLNSTAHYTHES